MKLTIDGFTLEQFQNMFCIETVSDMISFIMMLVNRGDHRARLVNTVI